MCRLQKWIRKGSLRSLAWSCKSCNPDLVLRRMFPFRTILFPTDFSAHAHAALKYAAGFARANAGRVLLLNVQDAKVPANLMTLPVHIFEDQENHWLLGLRSQAKELLADPLLSGVEADTLF